MICLSVKAAAGRHSASFALGHFDASVSGWTPGWSFFMGLLPVRAPYCFTSICMISSMAEEVHNPTVDLPRALVWQVPVGTVAGVVFILPILFTLPDIATLVAVPGGQPIGVLFTMVMGSQGGGFGMWFIVFMVGIFCGISVGCAASRATRAFARDKALPFHEFFSRVSPRTGIPLNAYFLSTLVQVLLGLIYLGSPTAFNAFVGVAVMCLGTSNAIPIAINLANNRKGITDSPFSLGRLGVPLNVVAVVWIMFEIVLFSMPAVVPVTPATMNYALVVFVGFGAFSGVWYMINGRYYYTGPPEPEDLAEGKDESGTSSQTRDIVEDEVVEKS
ncbi:hypothetical protein L218DRAFT_960705 [Marasmius fiardii PR-910]|nr:hypothetical protein L218DRAFT_960705 [Marasmius fiardii PR-910]